MSSAQTGAGQAPPRTAAAPAQLDRQARRLAWVTVGVPTLGTAAAIVFAAHYGFTWTDALLLVVMYAITSLGVEGGFHRFFSHRSFAAGPLVTTLWGIAGSMAAQGPVVFWVAIHRQHHAFTDRDGDPHSPRPLGPGPAGRLRGFWHGHVGWLFTVQRQDWARRAPDMVRDRLVMRLNQYYFAWVLAGLALPALAGWLLSAGTARGAVGGLLWGGLARIFLLDHVTWAVNSIGHTIGHRPYPTRDTSRNVAPLAAISVGGSWHNNHHARPSLAHNRHNLLQIDPTGAVIRALDALGLVHDARYPERMRHHPTTRHRTPHPPAPSTPAPDSPATPAPGGPATSAPGGRTAHTPGRSAPDPATRTPEQSAPAPAPPVRTPDAPPTHTPERPARTADTQPAHAPKHISHREEGS
ncbi:fatty acid desaturase [Streptomyces murinus]|uniref:acyl-CoA desaturase n=1 Tax=Streptomyces murinus TaxID=33900 RepID=UPI002E80111A|nr:fatty acid desaturase [Streptomyces murinus]WUD04767.1 fatty acid desaturase [Streptomyces murinus]WUD11460.1 fatty acid desaturase [Streptomyces murinus]